APRDGATAVCAPRGRGANLHSTRRLHKASVLVACSHAWHRGRTAVAPSSAPPAASTPSPRKDRSRMTTSPHPGTAPSADPAHPEIVRAALDADKDVICEKPLALDPADARDLAAHAERTGRTLFPAHVVRFFPQYAAAERAIATGAVGRLAVLRFERTGSLPDRAWYADDELSGGIVMDQMIHDIDQALWLAGPVERVYAQQSIASSDTAVRTAHVVLTHRSGA